MTPLWPRTLPALITPFDHNCEIDVDLHTKNLKVVTARGAEGVLIAGSTGEGPYLESGERELLVSTTRSSHPELTIICGISAETDRQADTQITEAVSGGADAVLVVTPGTLVRNRTKPITEYYLRVAERSELPLLLYTVPSVTGYELPVEAIRELAEHQNIIGMKDSGGDVLRLNDLEEVIKGGFIIYAGKSRALFMSHANGAFGAITASANYAYHLVDAAIAGDIEAQGALDRVTDVVEKHGVPGTKFAASLSDLRQGSCRPPLHALDRRAKISIIEAYETMIS